MTTNFLFTKYLEKKRRNYKRWIDQFVVNKWNFFFLIFQIYKSTKENIKGMVICVHYANLIKKWTHTHTHILFMFTYNKVKQISIFWLMIPGILNVSSKRNVLIKKNLKYRSRFEHVTWKIYIYWSVFMHLCERKNYINRLAILD